jgi:hypothetical protein
VINLVGVVNQPIQSGVTDEVMPFLDRELAGSDGGTRSLPCGTLPA